MTISDVRARLEALVEQAPYQLTRSPEPFSFELAPAQASDACYYLETALTEAEGLFAHQSVELHTGTLWMACRVKRDAHAAYDTVQAWCNSLTASIGRDGDAAEYDGTVSGWTVPPPGPEDDVVIGRMTMILDFERGL